MLTIMFNTHFCFFGEAYFEPCNHTYFGHAIATSTRINPATEYLKLIPEILQFGKERADILIEMG
jgi:hypothetical protein